MPIFRTQPASWRRSFRGYATVFFLCASLACSGRGASASTYQINFDATNLTVGSTYGLSFELRNGMLDNSLQASVSNFSLLGGTLGSGSSSIGSNSAVGNLNSTLSLATFDGSDFFDLSDYVQEFSSTTSSAVMAFTLDLSSSAPQTDLSDPDFFRFTFLDETSTPVATTNTGPDGDGISLLYAQFDSTSPRLQTYRTSSKSGPQVVAQIVPSAAPEPGTLALLLPSGAALAARLHYRRKRTLTGA